jgi:hypothetical protein
MRYINELFPEGSFCRTHRLWDGKIKFGLWDRIKCFFGFHPIDFWVAGGAEHCASCNWYHNTTLRQRLRAVMGLVGRGVLAGWSRASRGVVGTT